MKIDKNTKLLQQGKFFADTVREYVEIIALVCQHERQRVIEAIGKKRVYAPQGANFDQQARCEQTNAGISMAVAAVEGMV